jgi:hypothetical protein
MIESITVVPVVSVLELSNADYTDIVTAGTTLLHLIESGILLFIAQSIDQPNAFFFSFPVCQAT